MSSQRFLNPICRKCSCALVHPVNWRTDRQKKFSYICRACENASNRASYKPAQKGPLICRACSVALVIGANHAACRAKIGERICIPCDNRLSSERRNRRKMTDGGITLAKARKAASDRRAKTRNAREGCKELIAAKFDLARRLEQIVGEPFEVDHIRALHNGGDHAAENMQILPRWLNRSKGTRTETWYSDQYLEAVIENRLPPADK